MTTIEASRSADATTPVSELPADRQPVDWRRVRRPLSVVALVMALVGAIASSLGSVAAGRLAVRLVVTKASSLRGNPTIKT